MRLGREKLIPGIALAGVAAVNAANASPLPEVAEKPVIEKSRQLLEREYNSRVVELQKFLDSLAATDVFGSSIAPAMDTLIDAKNPDHEWRVRKVEKAVKDFALQEIGKGFGGVDALIVRFTELEKYVRQQTPEFSPAHRRAVVKVLEGYRTVALRRYMGVRRNER